MSFDKKSNIFYNTEENKEDIKMFNNKRIEELYEEYKKMKNDSLFVFDLVALFDSPLINLEFCNFISFPMASILESAFIST